MDEGANEHSERMTTKDHFLGGRIELVQPRAGYRAGIDSIFLAAAIQAKPGESVLDVGAGVGAASLALAHRRPDLKIMGIEIQEDLAALAQDNIKANGCGANVSILQGDVGAPPPAFKEHSFDHVMTNPPYYEESRSKTSPHQGKAQANTEGDVGLDEWLKFCIRMLKPKGTLTVIHRTERGFDVMTNIWDYVGQINVYPLWPTPEKPARRLLIQGRKGIRGDASLLAGIVLHEGEEKYSPQAERILRHAEALEW